MAAFSNGEGKKSGSGVGFMMLAKKDFAIIGELFSDEIFQEQLGPKPYWHGLQERSQADGSELKIGGKKAFEFDEGLFIETDKGDILDRDPCFLQAIVHRVFGEGCVVLKARKALFLCRRDDGAVFDQTRRAVVVKSR